MNYTNEQIKALIEIAKQEAYANGYKKGQADLIDNDKFLALILEWSALSDDGKTYWGKDTDLGELSDFKEYCKAAIKKACDAVRETPDDTHPLHEQGKGNAALTASSESAGAGEHALCAGSQTREGAKPFSAAKHGPSPAPEQPRKKEASG